MRNKKGFTLIEMVVVLAVIAILAAILAPTLTRYIESARVHRAESDCKVIASAIATFNADVGEWPIWKAASAMQDSSAAYDLLYGPGTNPVVGTGLTTWTSILGATAKIDSLSSQLNANKPSYSVVQGRRQFKGPYLSESSGKQDIGIDPWGDRYLVVVKSLKPGAGANASYVLSAGPNKVIETPYDMALGGGVTPGPGGDDIWCPIR